MDSLKYTGFVKANTGSKSCNRTIKSVKGGKVVSG